MHTAAVEGDAIGQGSAGHWASWAAAVLYNGFGRYLQAAASAAHATEDPLMHHAMWALPELVEAAARTGDLRTASDAVEKLAQTTRGGGTDTGLGIEARSRALVHAGRVAEDLYREAIDRLGRTRRRPDLARAQLLYGEWLRRANRRVDARTQLRAAHDLLSTIGMTAFAERARRELLATGETPRKRTVETPVMLTAQEALIARLAADGQTNPEIGAQLFLSARTVEWHLRKIFSKLGITSRRELGGMLSSPV
jgi:ATP/maltotriose-dependent transcriptional regulator MalT